jgi:hypothetical protein
LGGEITGTMVTNPKTALGSSPCEDVGFGIIICSCGVERYVSNDQAHDKLSDNKD